MDWQPLRAASWSSSWVSPYFHPDYEPWKHLGFLPAGCKITHTHTHTPHNAQPHLLSHGIIKTSTFHPSSSCSEKQVAARRGETRTDIRNEAARERARGCVCVCVCHLCLLVSGRWGSLTEADNEGEGSDFTQTSSVKQPELQHGR